MRKIIDVRNLACPAPVIETKKAIETNKDCELEIITNSEESKENILRFLTTSKVEFVLEKLNNDFKILVNTENVMLAKDFKSSCEVDVKGKSFVISKNRIGEGSEELGTILIKAFIHTLTELDKKPDKLFFVNSGVYLTCADSQVLDDLKLLLEKGTNIFSCGTCLDYYGLKQKLSVGSVGNIFLMIEILANGGVFV